MHKKQLTLAEKLSSISLEAPVKQGIITTAIQRLN